MEKAPELVAPTKILESKEWEVKWSYHVESLKGAVSRMRSIMLRRRIVMEVHKVMPLEYLSGGNDLYLIGKDEGHEEVYFRMFKLRKRRALAKKVMTFSSTKTESGDIDDESDDDDDIDYEDDLTEDYSVASSVETNSIVSEEKRWRQRCKLRVDRIDIKKMKRDTCVIVLTYTKKDGTLFSKTREVTFSTSTDANEFAEQLQKYQHRELMARDQLFNRAIRNVKADLKLLPEMKNEPLSLLIEMVSAKNLPIGDKFSSDPYVSAFLGNKFLHKTKYIEKSLNPIWTIESKSFFIIESTIRELFESPHGLTLLIKDYDALSKDDFLGFASIPTHDLYVANEERMEYEIQTSAVEKNNSIVISRSSTIEKIDGVSKSIPKICIRCRRATQYDKDFLNNCYNKSNNTKDMLSPASTPNKDIIESHREGNIRTSIKKTLKTKRQSPDKTYQYKVFPRPHPERIHETKWMSSEKMDLEVMRPSEIWIDLTNSADSRHLFGSLHVEVLKCRNLPNLDVGAIMGNKSDPFVALVYNGNYVRTEVIEDKLNPNWLPWTQRAFVFPMIHPSSHLFLGVYDHDYLSDHDLIGRISIDVTPFSPNTEYVLDYNLYRTARIAKRDKTFGQVTVRLRFDIENPRNMARVYFGKPPKRFINVKEKKEFRFLRKTVYGKYDKETFNFETIKAYAEELYLIFLHTYVYVSEALCHVLLWRSTMKIDIKIPSFFPQKKTTGDFVQIDESSDSGIGLDNDFRKKEWLKDCTLSIPLYSILAFFTSVTAVDQPTLIPSYVFLWIALLFLGSMQFRNSDPDPWGHCKGFIQTLELYLFRFPKLGHRIKPNEYRKDALEFNQFWKTKIENTELVLLERIKALVKAQERYCREIGDLDFDFTSKDGDINPMKKTLWPLQMWLGFLCDGVRLVKNVVTWEESHISFFITFICLALSIVLYFLPWNFIVYWLCRIFVWVVFGPWMMLLDKFYFSKTKPLTKEEILLHERERSEEYWVPSEKLALKAQINREYYVKLAAMKKQIFGKFMLQVPVFKFDRFSDRPLSSSVMKLVEVSDLVLDKIAVQKSGTVRIAGMSQSLVGQMIPRFGEAPMMTAVPTGQPTKNQAILPNYGSCEKNR